LAADTQAIPISFQESEKLGTGFAKLLGGLGREEDGHANFAEARAGWLCNAAELAGHL
jgi:hypothetical protein